MRENVQKALHWMKQLGNELEYIATSPLQAKFKLMLIMVYVDIFSQIWSDFIIKSGRRTQRGYTQFRSLYRDSTGSVSAAFAMSLFGCERLPMRTGILYSATRGEPIRTEGSP